MRAPHRRLQGARAVSNDIAGQGVANPTALTLSTSMMLRHLGLHSFSDRRAWSRGVCVHCSAQGLSHISKNTPHRLEAAVLDVYQSGDKAALTPDVGGNGTTQSLTNAIVGRLS